MREHAATKPSVSTRQTPAKHPFAPPVTLRPFPPWFRCNSGEPGLRGTVQTRHAVHSSAPVTFRTRLRAVLVNSSDD